MSAGLEFAKRMDALAEQIRKNDGKNPAKMLGVIEEALRAAVVHAMPSLIAERDDLAEHECCDDWENDELRDENESLRSDLEEARENAAAPLAGLSGDVNAAREHMRRHVEDLEHLPEWLRPELRALLHEGRLT